MSRRKWIIIVLAPMAGLVAILSVTLGVMAYVLPWDTIEAADRETRRQIRNYERTGNAQDLRRWITVYHGEAPGHQVLICLGDWSLKHPEHFLSLISGLKRDREYDFYRRFGFALADSGQDEAFLQAFQGYDTSELREIIKNIPDLTPW